MLLCCPRICVLTTLQLHAPICHCFDRWQPRFGRQPRAARPTCCAALTLDSFEAQLVQSGLEERIVCAVNLTKVKKKDREWKGALIEKAHKLCEDYADVYVFKHRNMRNDCFKELREVRAHQSSVPSHSLTA